VSVEAGRAIMDFDTQVVEIIGRHWLVGELLRAGLEVALPVRDRGVDLLVYSGEKLEPKEFVARPIQMKAATNEHFGVNRKYEKLPGLLHVFLWHVQSRNTRCFALYYPDMRKIAEEMGWTRTDSWKTGGKNKIPGYSTNAPSKTLCELLKKYEMTPEKWGAKVSPTKLNPPV
jgi:hypothetical protein